ncbi:putative GAG-pre-integrase domain-containing protein [Helianthus annuus]|nr:putative GAG-pre-integrase domain-containing protein [Helianthus annuus]
MHYILVNPEEIYSALKIFEKNGYHLKTISKNNIEYLQITSNKNGKETIVEQLEALSSGLYCTNINPIKSYMVSNQKLLDKDTFNIWYDRLGHPGSIMMRRIIKSATWHPLKNLKVLLPQDLLCAACSLGKLITRPSQTKLVHETPSFLERIQRDICGPIHPPCGPFRYFLVLIVHISSF